jgi:4'-phosphopantetheinyl transferase
MCPTPSSEEIQLIFSTLSASRDSEKYLHELLSTDEQKRAACFKYAKHRTSFIVARGLLRIVLGNYMNAEPAAIDFRYGPYGKPEVKGASPVHFSVSHSEQMVLFGLRLDREIGVDIERIRPIEDMEDIARRFFSPAECRDLLAIPKQHRTKAFYDCWTRKEAFIKFLGTGLSFPLDRFQVTLGPGDPVRLIHVDGQPSKAWFLQDIAPSDSHSAAVASEGRNCQCRVWKLERLEEGPHFLRWQPSPARR